MRGTRHDVTRVAHEYDADALLVAVPSADASLMSALDRAGRAAGLKVYTLPTVAQLVDGNVTSNQIREVNETDVLGRHPVEIDMDEVTGAGASIGSELCRQIARSASAAAGHARSRRVGAARGAN